MAQNRKIKIINTEYHTKQDIIYMNVEILEGQDKGNNIKLAILGKELMQSFGIDMDVPEDIMVKFLNDVQGKEVDWVLDSRLKGTPDFKKTEEVENHLLEIDRDPFHEVLQVEMEKK